MAGTLGCPSSRICAKGLGISSDSDSSESVVDNCGEGETTKASDCASSSAVGGNGACNCTLCLNSFSRSRSSSVLIFVPRSMSSSSWSTGCRGGVITLGAGSFSGMASGEIVTAGFSRTTEGTPIPPVDRIDGSVGASRCLEGTGGAVSSPGADEEEEGCTPFVEGEDEGS